jgi:uncharacterized iron-regulated protein
MATTSNLRARRNAAQLHALVGVEREIRANDSSSRRKYLREFSQAFRNYQGVLSAKNLDQALRAADTILIGDYHALPASQRFAAGALELRAQPGDRPVVLGLETIFARDQHIIDEWWRREIDEAEFRRRIRFDLDWGYAWDPFYELLVAAREHGEAIYGLDCVPREDLRKIGARDRHAAHKIAEIRTRHPQAAIMVLFGESHLAPGHLPYQVHKELPNEKTLTVLQNIDALYWQAAGEKQERVEAVQVTDNVVCAFNSTPLEKYESYRLHLSRWGRGEEEGPDLTPTIYNLIDSLVRFLGINRYSPHNTTQPKFLVDMLPEVCCGHSDEPLAQLLARKGMDDETVKDILHGVNEYGCVYLPQLNAFYVREFKIAYAAEEASRFLHHACRGLPQRAAKYQELPESSQAVEHALGYFGSRVLCPTRTEEGDAGTRTTRQKEQGYKMGKALYDDYVRGKLAQSALRRIFLTHVEEKREADILLKELTSRYGIA